MNPKPLSQARHHEIRRVLPALIRAAERARVIAAQTGTCVVVVRDGVLVIEPVRSSAPSAPQGVTS